MVSVLMFGHHVSDFSALFCHSGGFEERLATLSSDLANHVSDFCCTLASL